VTPLKIEGEHRFRAPRTAVWAALLDPEALRRAIPGCESLDRTGPDAYDLTVKIGIGAIKGTYRGTVRLTDQQPEHAYRMHVTGSGAPGSVEGDAALELEEAGDGETVVRYSGDVSARGAIARLGSRMLAGTAKLLIGQFFKRMDDVLAERVA